MAEEALGRLKVILGNSFPEIMPADVPLAEVSKLAIYPKITYTDDEKADIDQWVKNGFLLASTSWEKASVLEKNLLLTVNGHLSSKTTMLGTKPSMADIVLYTNLLPIASSWSPEECTGKSGHHHIIRFLDFVQNAPLFGLKIPESQKLHVDPNAVLYFHKPLDPKEEKERKRKEKAAADGKEGPAQPEAQGKGKGKGKEIAGENNSRTAPVPASSDLPQREKNDKRPKAGSQGKAPSQPSAPSQPRPQLIDLRVGHILQCIAHPDADSLFVSTIACGDPADAKNTSEFSGQVVRTVCSGLNGLIPLAEMQDRKVVVVCNLKPITMRGIKSCAMVLAASPRPALAPDGTEVPDDHKGPVELVEVPADVVAGERVAFEGWAGEPEEVLNPKKKVWETVQPGFTTSPELEVVFDSGAVPELAGSAEGSSKGVGRLLTASGGVCTVKSLKGAVVR